MPALGDVIRVIESGTMFGEVWKNVYHYNTALAGPLDTVEDFNIAFNSVFHPALDNIQTISVLYLERVIENLDDPLFFGEFPLAFAGVIVTPAMPSYVAYGVKLSRTFKTTRNGAKRYIGASESTVTDQNQILPVPSQDAVTDALITEIEPPAFPALVGSYVPVIFRPAGSVPSSPAQETNPIRAASFNLPITTQNSRKAGTGE